MTAAQLPVIDTNDYYTATEVEAILAEIKATTCNSIYQTATGNSVQLLNTLKAPATVVINGETVPRRVVFTPNTVRIIGGANWTYTAGASITFSGFPTLANNKTVVLTSVSGDTMTFPASSFTAVCETIGSITDGTTVYQISVDADHVQTNISQTSFDYILKAKNILRIFRTLPVTTSGVMLSYDNATGEFALNGTCASTVYFDLSYDTAFRNMYKMDRKATLSITRVSGTNTTDLRFYSKNTGTVPMQTTVTLGSADSSKSATATATANQYADSVIVSPLAGTYTNLKFKLQIEYGESATAWEIPSIVIAPILNQDTLGTQLENRGIPLTYNADGSVATWAAQDKVVKDIDGKYKLLNTLNKKVFNGAESWAYISSRDRTNTIYFQFDLSGAKPNDGAGSVSSNLFQEKDPDVLWVADVEGIAINANHNCVIRINKSRLITSDLVGFKAWLATNNLTAIYKLATPIDIELCAADQTALNSVAKTFAGITNIMLSDNKGTISVIASADINAYLPISTYSTLALRPTIGRVVGDRYVCTDQNPIQIFEWTGSAWLQTK